MNEIEEQDDRLTIEDLKNDFRYFLLFAFRMLDSVKGDPTEMQYDVAWQMQHGPSKMVLEAFRGFGKSLIASLYLIWKLWVDRDRLVLYTSASAGKAGKATSFMLEVMADIELLRPMLPTKDQRSSALGFDVNGRAIAHDTSVTALSITSNQVTGTRASDCCADDVESKANSLTLTMRERIQDTCRELGGALMRSKKEVPDAKMLYLGTPQIEESLYHVLPKRGYTVLIYPSVYPREEDLPLYKGRLAPIILKHLEEDPSLAGKPTEPTRFDEEELFEREAEYGRHGYQLQFLLLPTLAQEDRYPLRINDLIVMDLDADIAPEKLVWSSAPHLRYDQRDLPCSGFGSRDHFHRPAEIVGEWRPYTDSVMTVDISGRGKDECAFVVAKYLNGQIFVLEVGGFQVGTAEETLRELAKTAQRWGVNLVKGEENFGDGMWGQLFYPVLKKYAPGVAYEEIKSKGQKELRIIQTLDPVMTQHRLVLNRSAVMQDLDAAQRYGLGERSPPEEFQLIYQMARITEDRNCLAHDDRLDALQMAVAHFVEMMSGDRDQEMERVEKEKIADDLAAFSRWLKSGKAEKPRKDWYQFQ